MHFASDGDRLNGIVYVANGPGPHPTVILLHGFPGNEKNLDLAQSLRADGWNVLFFHYRRAWGSKGTYSFTHVFEDVAAAADYLRANAGSLRTDADRIILVGHSMDGFAALMAAARDDRIPRDPNRGRGTVARPADRYDHALGPGLPMTWKQGGRWKS